MMKFELARAFEAQSRHAVNLKLLYAERAEKRESDTIFSFQNYHKLSMSETAPHLDDEPELNFSTRWTGQRKRY